MYAKYIKHANVELDEKGFPIDAESQIKDGEKVIEDLSQLTFPIRDWQTFS